MSHRSANPAIAKTSRLSQRRWRRGISSVEYAIVLSMVCLFSVSAIVVLARSTRSSVSGLNEVLVGMDGERLSIDSMTASATEQEQALHSTLTCSTLRYQLFTGASSVCIIAFALIYIRQGRRLKQHQTENEMEVKFLRKQSVALQKIVDKRKRIHNSIRDDWNRLAGDGGKVGEFMSTDVFSIDREMRIDVAESLLREKGYRRVIVTHKDGGLAGVLSLKDISTKSGTIVADIMTSQPRTVTPDTDLQIALSMMLQNRISCLPVVEDSRLAGLISTSDMLMVLQCMLVSMDGEPANDQPLLVQN